MTDNQLNYLAYNYLTEHIFECEERLKKNTSDSVIKQLKQRIEVYEYLIKLIGGMVIENDDLCEDWMMFDKGETE